MFWENALPPHRRGLLETRVSLRPQRGDAAQLALVSVKPSQDGNLHIPNPTSHFSVYLHI